VIRIQKPSDPPAKLTQDGRKKRRSHCLSYSKKITSYQSGESKFSFDSNIYAHANVKKALIKAQHGKCCFCERRIGTDGDVEHFRPKQAYRQSKRQPLKRPGYYWLAYEWDNLYLACPGCNQRHKGNLFPLQNPANRAIDHHHGVEDEQPLFIDPGKDDPETLIGFRGEFAYALDGNRRAKETIDSLKLNERSLPESRLAELQELKILWLLAKETAPKRPDDTELQELARKAQLKVEQATQGNSEFTAAVRRAIETKFEFVID
jgi:uncharacterized protein (TIGR02646 family)